MAGDTKQHFIIGTAGHIDHGKTALVKALTGTNTDRLKEEQARGLTIDIGFAHYGENATIIDVPGHEKFVKNMVAGVSTIDLVLFVIAADDGVMPQTREHLDILNILQIRKGIVVINKTDLVESDWIELVEDDVKNLLIGTCLEKAPLLRVSSISGNGIPELKKTIDTTLEKLPPRHDRGVFWMPVDRSFSMKGFGTVVTGSILSGVLHTGDEIELLPQGKKSRVRGIQKHSSAVENAKSGDRAAINLHGLTKDEIARGDVLAAPALFKASKKIQGKVTLLKSSPDLKSNARVRIHLGTAEIMGRIRPLQGHKITAGATCFVQITLEKPIAARRLDLFVVRQYSPMFTIGGGVILDTQPGLLQKKHLSETMQRLQSLEKEDPAELVQEQFLRVASGIMTNQEVVSRTGLAENIVADAIATLEKQQILLRISKKGLAHTVRYQQSWQRINQLLLEFHEKNPIQIGYSKAELAQKLDKNLSPQFTQFAIEKMVAENKVRERAGFIALAAFEISLSDQQKDLKNEIATKLLQDRFSPSSVDELAGHFNIKPEAVAALLNLLVVEKTVLRLSNDFYFHQKPVAIAKENLIHYFQKNDKITISEFKTLIDDATRKYALPLLNYFDSIEVTSRDGDVRYPGIGAEE